MKSSQFVLFYKNTLMRSLLEELHWYILRLEWNFL